MILFVTSKDYKYPLPGDKLEIESSSTEDSVRQIKEHLLKKKYDYFCFLPTNIIIDINFRQPELSDDYGSFYTDFYIRENNVSIPFYQKSYPLTSKTLPIIFISPVILEKINDVKDDFVDIIISRYLSKHVAEFAYTIV